MIPELLVTVVIDGAIVAGSTPAVVRGGVVVAPVTPYARRFASRITGTGSVLVFERDGRTVRITLGSRSARASARMQPLPIAPYLRSGEAIIPLATVARALGADVAYDPRAHALRIDFTPVPLATMTPFAATDPPRLPLRTFAPVESPEPAPTVTGVPRPRRTPILIERRP